MTGGKKQSTASADQAAASGKEILEDTRGVRREFGSQTLELLRTGGAGTSGPLLPIQQQATEEALQAGSQTFDLTESSLQSIGAGNSPQAQAILGQIRLGAGQSAARARTDIAAALFGQAGSFGLQGANIGLTGLNQAAQTVAGINSANANAQATSTAGIASGAGALIGAIAILA